MTLQQQFWYVDSLKYLLGLIFFFLFENICEVNQFLHSLHLPAQML